MTEFDIDFPGEYGEDWPKRTPKRRPPKKPEGKALPRDADNDGFVYDGTIREMPAPMKRPRGMSWGWDWGGTPDRNPAARTAARRRRRAEREARAENRRRNAEVVQAGPLPKVEYGDVRGQTARELFHANEMIRDFGFRPGPPKEMEDGEGGLPLVSALRYSWVSQRAVADVIDPNDRRDADQVITDWTWGKTIDDIEPLLLKAFKRVNDPDVRDYDKRGPSSAEERRAKYGSTPAELTAWLKERMPRPGTEREGFYVTDDADVDAASAAVEAIDHLLTDYPEIASMMKAVGIGPGTMYTDSGLGEYGAARIDEIPTDATIVAGSHIAIDTEKIARVPSAEEITHSSIMGRGQSSTVSDIHPNPHPTDVPVEKKIERAVYAAVVHEMGHVLDTHRYIAENFINPDTKLSGLGPPEERPQVWWQEKIGVDSATKPGRLDMMTHWGSTPVPIRPGDLAIGVKEHPGTLKEPSSYGKAKDENAHEWWAESFAAWYMGLTIREVNDGFIERRLAENRDFDLAGFWAEHGVAYKAAKPENVDGDVIADTFEGSVIWQ